NGADDKFWSIKFKAENYGNFKVSSKQSSGGNNPGPRDFKLQWRLSGGIWEDVDDGTITVANDWTTGVVTNLPVPITGQGSSSIYIRWIMTSNTNSTGGTVESTGIAKIDDILVTGVNTLGVTEVLMTNRISVSPVPNNGTFRVESKVPLQNIRIYALNGKLVYENQTPAMSEQITLDQPSGLYLVRVLFEGSDQVCTRRGSPYLFSGSCFHIGERD
ncbi:MAG: T9SS type A sorting domain-containing protein, partial [Bacteroidota bacterium]